ncbi:MAG TPA: VOC family protein [Candidatus Sulfotelmatobacter sp.]|nr:VOC family protein [Candidatus Sulfotelmatobacter sp.]
MSKPTQPVNRIVFFVLACCVAAWLATPLVAQEPTRPPITGIAHVRVYVTDLRKSTDFYSRMLGLPMRSGGCTGMMRHCFILNDHQQVLLAEAPAARPANFLSEIAFATSDINRMRAYLIAHNVAAGPISRDINSVAYFSLHDPEGNNLAFVQFHPLTGSVAPTGKLSGRMLHAGFIVKDRAAEDRFYRDLLGFRMYWHGGFKDSGDDWWEIQVPDGSDWIEYMLNIPATADAKERGVQNHFSVGVEKIQSAVSQLHQNGVEKFDGPEIGRDGKWSLDVYDPDDTRVEVMEFTPAKDPCCHPYTADHPKP